MSEFSPGQRVICIDGKFHPAVWEFVDEVPIEGEVYTVRFVRHGPDTMTGKFGPALALEEICGRLPHTEGEVCWVARRFAPVDIADVAADTTKKKSAIRQNRNPQPRHRTAKTNTV